MIEPSREEITRAVESLLAAQSWDEKKSLVEAQRDLLLTNSADQILVHLLEQYRGDANTTHLLEEHRQLLAYCRRDGIEVAFANHLPTGCATRLQQASRKVRGTFLRLGNRSKGGEGEREEM